MSDLLNKLRSDFELVSRHCVESGEWTKDDAAEFGQAIKATLVLAPGYEPSDELTKQLQDWVKSETAPYKYPRVIEYVAELPKTISGKIKRAEIRQRDLEKYGAREM